MTSPSTVVITMVQADDFPAAWSSLVPIGDQLSPERQRVILFNDEADDVLLGELRALPHTRVLAPGENLGVARGRNALFEEALALGALSIVAIDSDIYVPADYLDRVSDLQASADQDVGVIAPTVLAFGEFARANPDLVDGSAALDGRIAQTHRTDTIRERIDVDSRSLFYHLGVVDWRSHYLSPASGDGRLVAKALRGAGLLPRHSGNRRSGSKTFLASDPVAVGQAAASSERQLIEVDALAGGVSIYSGDMLRKVGLCDDRFSPFGYEDADLCVRARRHGYRHAWAPALVLLHDFRSTGQVRNGVYLAFVAGRARALLAGLHLNADELLEQLGHGLSSFQADAQAVARTRSAGRLRPESQWAVAAAFLSGYLHGATQGGETDAAMLDRLTSDLRGDRLESGDGVRWLVTDTQVYAPMGPRLTLDVARGLSGGQESITAKLDLRFPDGLEVTLEASFDYGQDVHPSEVLVRSIRCAWGGLGFTMRRIRGSESQADCNSAADGASASERDPFVAASSHFRGLLCPDGRSASFDLRIDPPLPASLMDFTRSQRPDEFAHRFGVNIRQSDAVIGAEMVR